MALGQLGEPPRADPVGGGLGAQVGEALAREAHLRGELLQGAGIGAGRRDHHALLLERGRARRHAAGGRPADVGVVGAAGGEADHLARGEDGRDQGDVGQVGAALVGVVEDPRVAWALLQLEYGGDRVRHRAEVDGDVLGLHDQLSGGVKERGRAVVALLDVGRVGGAD